MNAWALSASCSGIEISLILMSTYVRIPLTGIFLRLLSRLCLFLFF